MISWLEICLLNSITPSANFIVQFKKIKSVIWVEKWNLFSSFGAVRLNGTCFSTFLQKSSRPSKLKFLLTHLKHSSLLNKRRFCEHKIMKVRLEKYLLVDEFLHFAANKWSCLERTLEAWRVCLCLFGWGLWEFERGIECLREGMDTLKAGLHHRIFKRVCFVKNNFMLLDPKRHSLFLISLKLSRTTT